MKKLLGALGVVVLMAVILSVTLTATVGADAEPTSKTLVVDWVGTFDNAAEIGKTCVDLGEFEQFTWAGTADLYAEGTFGAEPRIGEEVFSIVSTEPEGVCGWYGTASYNIFGEGIIEVTSHGLPWEGAILGGMGIFTGASGEYTVVGIGGGVFRVTFTFENPLKVNFVTPDGFGPWPSGTTVFVDADNTSGVEDGSAANPFNTIQEGIDAATSGDVVGVAEGVYVENVVHTKDGVDLLGEGAFGTTVIDGGNVILNGVGITFSGFRIQNYLGRAITVEDGDVVIEKNLITDPGSAGCFAAVRLDGSGTLVFQNNVIANTIYGIWVPDGTFGTTGFNGDAVIANNTMNNVSGCAAVTASSFPSIGIDITGLAGANVTVRNNSITNGDGYGVADTGGVAAITLSNNNVFGNTLGNYCPGGTVIGAAGTCSAIAPGPGAISSDPLYVNPGALDFHLQAGSPNKNAGTSTDAPSDDFDGDTRPFGSSVDIGADEFTSGP